MGTQQLCNKLQCNLLIIKMYINLNQTLYTCQTMEKINSKFEIILQKIGRDNAAYLSWFIASILWSISFIFPNQNNIDSFSSNLSRGMALFLYNSIGLYWRQLFTSEPPSHQQLSSKQLFFVSVRHVLLSIYGLGFAQAQFYLPAPVVYTIYFSGPLFIMIIDYTYYNTKISKQQTIGVILTGAGVLLTANGQALWAWMMDYNQFSTTFKNYKTDNFYVKSMVALIMIFLTFGWACAQIMVRQVRNKNHWQINMNFGIILTAISGIIYMNNPQNSLKGNPELFAKCLLYQGVIIAIAQTFFMAALLLSKKSGPITMIGFIGVIVSYFISVLRYHQPLSLFCVLGAFLALIGIYKTVK